MNKKLFNFRFKPEITEDLNFLQTKLHAKNRTNTIEKAIKKYSDSLNEKLKIEVEYLPNIPKGYLMIGRE